MTTPNRIRLKSWDGRYEEGITDGVVYPGMIVRRQTTDKMKAHDVAGGAGPLAVVEEDALQGKTIDDSIADATFLPFWYPKPGDMLLFRLAAGQNVAIGDKLMSAGDGTLTSLTGIGPNFLANNVADSSNITNVTAETTFSNGTVSIPANTLKAGDVIRIRGTAVVTGQNSTNTHQVKVKIGSTTLADSGAVSLAASDVVEFDLYLTVRDIGATGHFVVMGQINFGTPGTATWRAVNVASTVIDTTAAASITITSTASAQSTGNVIKLSQLQVSQTSSGGFMPLVEAAEAVDNSLGSTNTFIRGWVI